MGLQTELLRSSFSLVVEREPEVTRRFYEILFTRHPDLQPLFTRNDSATQQRMLAEALVAVLEHIEDESWLADKLGSLGAKHVGYGVTEPMYDQVGECLLATLADVAGDDWSDDLASAWADAYTAITSLMLAGTGPVEESVH